MAMDMSWGILEHFHNSSGIIPSFLFNSADASQHIFDFLDNSLYQNFNGSDTHDGSVTDWTQWCSSPDSIFLGYGPFLGCLLYPNTTANVAKDKFPAASKKNLSDIGFSPKNDDVSLSVRNTYTTCLPIYCSGQDDCGDVCDVGNLLTSGYQLSAEGVGKCWETLCSLDLQTTDGDIAGIGILISYLIQLWIAIVGLVAMAVLSFMVNRHHKHNPHEQEPTREDESIRTVRDHYIAVHSFLSDFHKAQCYLSIALQIAGLIILFKDPSATSYSDMHFLYFVAVDGLFPIIITLYTLMTFGKKSWYMISLSGISIILSSIMGGHLSFSIRDMTRNGSTGGGSWPDICGGVGPTTLCNGVGSNAVTYGSVVSAFLYAMVAIDVLFFLFIVWKLFTETTNLWESGTRGISRVFKANPRWLRRCITYFLHVLAIALIIFFLALDMHYFHLTFQGPFVDFTGWSFGQIVGITTWAGAFVDFIYLEYMGVSKGLEWRLPSFVHLRETIRTLTQQTSADETVVEETNEKGHQQAYQQQYQQPYQQSHDQSYQPPHDQSYQQPHEQQYQQPY